MNRAFIQTLRSPHEQFGIPMPIGRRLGDVGRGTWLALMFVLTLGFVGVYVYEVNVSATKGYVMRTLDKKMERLQESVKSLENQTAQQRSIQSIQERLQGENYVPVDKMEYVAPLRDAYAMAK